MYSLRSQKEKKKVVTISHMSKQGNLPEGIYAFEEPNTWYPVVYFRKAKHADPKMYRWILDYLKGMKS